MSVTKRTRYEVLRRDNHTCRYCGGTAPDVQLQVDHVIPSTLGGSDNPDNLVAACKDCNAGKSSSSASESVVDGVSQKALALAEAFKYQLTQEVASLQLAEAYRDEFIDSWNNWTTCAGDPIELPADWRGTIDYWQRVEVPIEILTHAIDTAMAKISIRNNVKFKYMCGIVWRTLDNAQQRVTAEQPQVDGFPRIITCAQEHCESPAILEEDDDPESTMCTLCESQHSWQAAMEIGERRGWKLRGEHDYYFNPLSVVVDGIPDMSKMRGAA